MKNEIDFENQGVGISAMATPAITGAVIAFVVISFFVFGIDNTNPEWGNYWRIKPLILTPFAGAVGGIFYAFLKNRVLSGFNRILATLLGIAVFIVILWIGIVLGLNGTMWD